MKVGENALTMTMRITAVKLPGALRRGFLREEACASFARAGAAAPPQCGCQPQSGWTFSGFFP